MGDFDTKQAEQRVGTIMGDCLGHYRKHLSGQTAIAFCCSVAHAEAVAGLFQSAGIAAASIDGSMDAGTRRELLQRLAVGDLKVLTSCALIGEGVDVPSGRRLHPAAAYGQRWAPPADDRSMPAPATWQDCGSAGSCRQYAPAWPPPRRARLDARWLRKRDREAAPSVKVCPQCFSHQHQHRAGMPRLRACICTTRAPGAATG
jgi:DNA repair protein RadD